MMASARHSFEIKNLQVPSNRLFNIDPSYAVLPHPIYQYPFLQFAEATLAVNMAGMAMHFIDLAKDILKQKKLFENKATEAEYLLDYARISFYEIIHQSWNELTSNKSIHRKLLNKVSDTSRSLAATARRQVDELWILNTLIIENKTKQRSLILEIKLHVSESTRQENIFITEDLKECCVNTRNIVLTHTNTKAGDGLK